MTTPQPQPEPSVSDEDIDTAISRVAEAIQGPAYGKASVEKARRAVAAIIALDWGPRPTVPADDLAEVIRQAREAGPASAYHRLVNRLRECGIEVTE